MADLIISGMSLTGGGMTITLPPASAIIADTYFNYTTVLLSGDGTNNATNATFVDSSTNNFTITRNGNTTQGTFSPYGGNWSNYFDGTDDVLSFPNNAVFAFGTGSFTIEFWINAPLNNDKFILEGRNAIGTMHITTGGYLSTAGVLRYNGSSTIVSSNVITDNAWHHCAIVRNGSSNITLYVDGTSVGTGTDTTNYTTTTGTFNGIGGRAAVGNYLTGYLSNFRIVKGTAVYTSAFTPSTTPLTPITNTSLLTCQSNRFIDNSTNAFTITRNGDVSVQRFSPFSPSAAYSAATNGGSAYFDNSGDYLTVPSTAELEPGSGNFTIEAWVYPLSYPSVGTGDAIIARLNSSGYNNFSVNMRNNGNIEAYFSLSNTATPPDNINAGPVLLNAWSHIAFVKNGLGRTLYINGVSVGTVTSASNPPTGLSTVTNIGTADSDFNGYISGLRVTKSIVYSTGFIPPTTPPTVIANTSLLTNYTNAGIIDNAMMNNLETVGDAKISTTQSKFGGSSIFFDGTGDKLVSPPSELMNLATGDFTVEGWIYTNTTIGSHSVAMRGASSGIATGADIQWNIYQSGTSMIVRPYSSATDYTINVGTITSGVWYHIALVRSGNTFMGFLNGVKSGTTQTISGALNNNTIWYGYIVGLAALTTGDEAWNGYIDDFRITKGYARYTTTFTPPTAALPTQ